MRYFASPELLTADLEEELQQLHTEFITQRERLAEELKELCKVLKRLRVKEKLQRLRPELIIQRERVEGSSPPLVSTVEVELEELLKKLQKRRMEGECTFRQKIIVVECF